MCWGVRGRWVSSVLACLSLLCKHKNPDVSTRAEEPGFINVGLLKLIRAVGEGQEPLCFPSSAPVNHKIAFISPGPGYRSLGSTPTQGRCLALCHPPTHLWEDLSPWSGAWLGVYLIILSLHWCSPLAVDMLAGPLHCTSMVGEDHRTRAISHRFSLAI